MYTDEKIQERAREIGNRDYFPVPPLFYHPEGGVDRATGGITIRGELLKTAMGNLCSNPACIYRPQQDNGINYASESISVIAKDIANAMLTQMAKDELGLEE